jgi:hypothetical protein
MGCGVDSKDECAFIRWGCVSAESTTWIYRRKAMMNDSFLDAECNS